KDTPSLFFLKIMYIIKSMKVISSLLKINKGLIIILVLFIFLPTIVSATTPPFVRCGPGTAKTVCELCDLFTMGGRIADFALKIAGTLAVLVTMLGGMTYLTSFGDQQRLTKAKQIFLAGLYGLIYIFLAWSFVVIAYRAVGAGNPVYWWDVC
ncbi:MAG: hypothetical protein KY054_02915, partial [Candidatus Nealsonbacteria bacterium]|nr:hypothetical protein [Candidatus Nealsonbacteria bacterium]